jgi:hypothetical protein
MRKILAKQFISSGVVFQATLACFGGVIATIGIPRGNSWSHQDFERHIVWSCRARNCYSSVKELGQWRLTF